MNPARSGMDIPNARGYRQNPMEAPLITIDRGGRGSPSFNRSKRDAAKVLAWWLALRGKPVVLVTPWLQNDEDLPEGRPV